MSIDTSIFGPASPGAEAILRLFGTLTLFSALIFAIVLGVTLYSVIRFRAKPGQGEPRQVFGHTRLEILWTVAPAALILVIGVLSFNTLRVVDPARNDQPPELILTGHQWWWEVEYPQAGFVTANEIHIPVGQPVWIQLESADVIHDFWVPKLGRKMDAVPGRSNYLRLEADAPGVYVGACAEFCGAQHAWMRLRVIAQTPAEYAAWQQAQAAIPPPPTETVALQGAKRFQELTCVNCHAIRGTGAQANAGPDLTHIASRQTLGAGVLDNTTANLTKWLTNPQAVKPGNRMPHFSLSSTDLSALVAYLETLR